MFIHVVRPGETLWLLANRYGVSQSAIISANGLTRPDRLLVGQALIIPLEVGFHTVRRGETLWSIARNYGTTVEEIVRLNNIVNPTFINPGLFLYIPAIRHIISPGQSLWQIAQLYNVSLEDLIKINNIQNPDLVYPGMEVVIPRKRRPLIEVNGYIYLLGEQAGPIVREVGQHLTYVSPFAYRIREDGTLERIDDNAAINAAYAENAIPMMSITNFTSTELGANLAHVVLSSPSIQDRLIENIIGVLREKGYQGINVDFENVLPQDRELYNSFLQRTVNRLHPLGYFVSTALAPKTGPGQIGRAHV